DLYASCLLMPRKLVFAAWDKMFPDRKQRVLQPSTSIVHQYVEVERIPVNNSAADDYVLEGFACPLAQLFLVSPIAMRIRLEKLGLLLREIPHQAIFGGGV